MEHKYYHVTLTKSSSLPGRPANFEDGYKAQGMFCNLPIVAECFNMTPDSGEFKHGFFRTSYVNSIDKSTHNTVTFTTLNSTYQLKYKELSL